jgi:hypothetical protein
VINVTDVSTQRLPQSLRILAFGDEQLFRFYELRHGCRFHIDSFGTNIVFVVQTESMLRSFGEVPKALAGIFNVTNRTHS